MPYTMGICSETKCYNRTFTRVGEVTKDYNFNLTAHDYDTCEVTAAELSAAGITLNANSRFIVEELTGAYLPVIISRCYVRNGNIVVGVVNASNSAKAGSIRIRVTVFE